MMFMMLYQEQDVGWFFSRANELEINVEWRQVLDNTTSEYKPIIFNKELPLEIELKQDKNKIQCILKNRLEWLQTHCFGCLFRQTKGSIVFQMDISKNPLKIIFKLSG